MQGIRYTSTCLSPSGYGSAARQDITALYSVGVDITCQTIYQMAERTSYGWQGELCANLEDRDIPYKINLIHLTPDTALNYLEKDKYNISRLFWETDRLPHGWADACNKMGEIWASSEAMGELLRASGVKVPIYAFPQPIDIANADRNYGKYTIENFEGFLFYSIFQWIERKNPKGLITSYWKAFTGRDDVGLLLKTYRVNYTEAEVGKIVADISEWKRELHLGHYPKIFIASKLLTQEQLMKLHHTGDCYISADHGEGWARPLQEALLLGKPAISTARGGLHEYLNTDHYFPIPSEYVPVIQQSWIPYYTSDQNWAEPNYDKLIGAMRWVFGNRELAQAKGIVAKNYIKDKFNFYRCGMMMRERLEKIYSKL